MTESQHGDGDDDDPQLRAMRAVWLAMPDEDPPSRGLAELMAAARVKADELTPYLRAPWWRRLLEMFRRPMVLALATIMVLIGGAVLVTQHRDQMVEPTTETTPRGGARRGQVPAEQPPMTPTGGADKAPESPVGGAAPAAATAPSQRPAAPPPRIANPRPPATPPPAHTHASTLDRGARPATTEPATPGFAAPPQPRPEPVMPPKVAPDQADALQDESTTRAPRQVLVGELFQQCQSAATRGDCEAAKLIARRIAKQDASYYREHVASDVTISKCIAPSE